MFSSFFYCSIQNIAMSSFRWKYNNKIFIIFFFISITLDEHRIACVKSNQSFCDKLFNAKPSPSFSLADLLRMQMFTFAQDNKLVMVADGVRYVLNTQDLEEGEYKSILIDEESIDKPWLSKQLTSTPDSIAKVVSGAELPFDEPLEMAYELATPTGRIVMLVTNKMIYEYSEETNNLIQKIDRSNLKFSIVHDQVSPTESNAYVLSQVPGENVGLLIYQLKLSNDEKCVLAVNSDCLNEMAHFYLRRDMYGKILRVVHPKSDRMKSVKIAPLSERPPIGFIFAGRLYLFDADLGCVYIFPDWGKFDLARRFADKGIDIVLNRKNILFEYFFRCTSYPSSQLLAFLPKIRCHTTYRTNLTNLRREIFTKYSGLGFIDGKNMADPSNRGSTKSPSSGVDSSSDFSDEFSLDPSNDDVNAQVTSNIYSSLTIFALVAIGIILFGVLPIMMLIRRRRNPERKDPLHKRMTDIKHVGAGLGAKSKKNDTSLSSKNRKKLQKLDSITKIISSRSISTLDKTSKKSSNKTSERNT